MAGKKPFDEEETAIMLDYYMQFRDGKLTKKEAISRTSQELRNRAKQQGVEIDNAFRSEDGIKMQMTIMEDLVMGGKRWHLNKAPQVFEHVLEQYIHDRASFDNLLQKARGSKGVLTSVQEAFFGWLADKVSDVQLSDLYFTYSEIESFCLERKLLHKPLFETTDLETILQIKKTVNANMFSSKKRMAIQYYYDFLKSPAFAEMATSAEPPLPINDVPIPKRDEDYLVSEMEENVSPNEITDASPMPAEVTQDAPVIIPVEADRSLLIELLIENQVEYIDNRDRGGFLWIKGGYELYNLVQICQEELDVTFHYIAGGVRVFDGQAGWGTLGKEKPIVASTVKPALVSPVTANAHIATQQTTIESVVEPVQASMVDNTLSRDEEAASQEKEVADDEPMIPEEEQESDETIEEDALTESEQIEQAEGECVRCPINIIHSSALEQELVSVEYFEEVYPVKEWAQLYVQVVRCLHSDYPQIIEGLCGHNIYQIGQTIDLADDESVMQMTAPQVITEGLYLRTSLTPLAIVSKIMKLLDLCKIDYEHIVITYREAKASDHLNGVIADTASSLKAMSNVLPASNDDPMIDYLIKNGVKYIDKRQKGGHLWIKGGHELDDIVSYCKHKFKVFFHLMSNGTAEFDGAAGWWTNGKAQTTGAPKKQLPKALDDNAEAIATSNVQAEQAVEEKMDIAPSDDGEPIEKAVLENAAKQALEAMPAVDASTGDPLLDYLLKNGVEYVDRRPMKGCLWIKGGHELDELVEYCYSKFRVSFRYMPDGTNAFNGVPGWRASEQTKGLDNKQTDTTITDLGQGGHLPKADIAAEQQQCAESDDPLIAYLAENDVEYIDKRPIKRGLWIKGGHELDELIKACHTNYGVKFYHMPSQARVFDGLPTWWTSDETKQVAQSALQKDAHQNYPDGTTVAPKQEAVSNNHKGGHTVAHAIHTQDKPLDTYETILRQEFPKGYRLGSKLDLKRFASCYNDAFGTQWDVNDQAIQIRMEQAIRQAGIQHDNWVFAIESLVNQETKEHLLADIEKRFAQGAAVIYYSALFQAFREEFLEQQINDADMLRTYLAHICKGQYIFNQDFLAREKNVRVDLGEEVENRLIKENAPMKVETLCQELPHLPVDQIEKAVKESKNCIKNAPKEYFHIAIIDFTDEELADIADMLKQMLDDAQFVSGKELIGALRQKYPNMLERFPLISDNGLRDAIAYYMDGEFFFNGSVFSKIDRIVVSPVQDFIASRSAFTMDELTTLGKEAKISINLATVYKSALRINDQQFVSKDEVTAFDVEAIDKAIASFCPGDYIALAEVASFADFPYVGFPWNYYLLEQYVAGYSKEFRLVHVGFALNSYAGAIVRQKSRFTRLDDVLIDALAKSDIDLQETVAMHYLRNKGYLATRSYSGLDKVLMRAKVQRGGR